MLDYFALGMLFFAAITMFYGIIVIHDIPYEIAVHRNHPHQDSIHVAGWISMFTLGAIWPFLWIWATLYREDRGWGFSNGQSSAQKSPDPVVASLQQKISELHERVIALEGCAPEGSSTTENKADSVVESVSDNIDEKNDENLDKKNDKKKDKKKDKNADAEKGGDA